MSVLERAAPTVPDSVPRGRSFPWAKLKLATVDLCAVALSMTAATAFTPSGEDGSWALGLALMAAPLWLSRARLYSARFISRRTDEIRRIFDAHALAAATVCVGAFIFGWSVAPLWVGVAFTLSCIAVVIDREYFRRRYEKLRRSGKQRRRVLLIGDNEEGKRFSQMFAEFPEIGYDVSETLSPTVYRDAIGMTTAVLRAAHEHDVSGVVIAATALEVGTTNRLIRDLVDRGIHVELSSTLVDIAHNRLTVRPLGAYPMMYIESAQRAGWRAVAKRAFDLTVSLTALMLLAPPMVAVAYAIRRETQGPMIFRQPRVGRNGKLFDVLKFRTMVANAEDMKPGLAHMNEGAGPLFKMKNDPRVTAVGGFLRKTSMDELPQLWNVVRGEMSLVGPRPALQSEMEAWESDIYGRLRVKPGITGMWQVSGRSSTTFEEYTRLDLYYVDNWSLFVDLAILLKTIPAVLKSDGAY